MLDGLRDWLDNGLPVAAETREATAEYRRDSDQLGRFLEACTEPAPGERVQSSVLHEVFNAWSVANSLSEWKGRGFSEAMTERGWRKDKSSVVFFLDLKLTKTKRDFVDDNGRPWRAGAPAQDGDSANSAGDWKDRDEFSL
jgi:putative DNA primase/helicase